MPTYTPLEDEVIASLDEDPRIPESAEIAVSADAGIVTLRGTVESFRQRRAAAQDARKVESVYDVDDQLNVSLPGPDRREDNEIRGIALQTLAWDTEVPSDFIDVKVEDGWATLRATSAISLRATRLTTTWPACRAFTASRTRSGSTNP